MKISKLTFLGFYLNGALGSGKYDNITIEKVKQELHNRTIFDYLSTELGDNIDLSILTADDKQELIEEWDDMAVALDEGRKMNVDRNGLCLLVAYLFNGIQRRLS